MPNPQGCCELAVTGAPAQIVERILDEILAFGKDCSQKDDMTLVVAAVKDEV